MPFSAGVFTRIYDWLNDQQRNVKVIGSRLNDEFDGVGSALASIFGTTRQKLTASRVYYVRTNGSDSNDGLANTAGGAFLTIQHAIDVIKALDHNGYNITVLIADGAYNAAVLADGEWVGAGIVLLQGNLTTPANVTITLTGSAAITATNGAVLYVAGMTLTTISANTMQALFRGEIYFFSVVFGGAAGLAGIAAVYANRFGYIESIGDWSLTGDVSGYLIQASHAGQFRTSTGTCTIGGAGSRILTTVFYVDGLSEIVFSGTSSIVATVTVLAERWREEGGGYIQVAGLRSPDAGFEAFFPGSVGGRKLVQGGTIVRKVILPATITADQNDYVPVDTGTPITPYPSASVIEIASNAARTITGIAKSQTVSLGNYSSLLGQEFVLTNIGGFPITLKALSGSSLATSQFAFSADYVLPSLGSVRIYRCPYNDWWRLASGNSDIFLTSGGVINFNNANYTLTHSAGNLTATGGPFTAPSFMPSGTTVPTNGLYLPAVNTLGWAINSAGEVQLTSTAFSPMTSDGNALGTTALMWSDLFLATGGVLNWNNGTYTVTQSSTTLAFSGGITLATALPVASGGTGETGAAWTTYTPTVTPRTGAITSYTVNSASYQQIGKTVRGHFDVTISNAGTGSQQLFVSLPVTARSQFQLCFGEDFATAKSAGGTISTAGGGDYTKIGFLYYDGTTLIVTGTQLVCNFEYEAA